jgi:transcriptional regulator with XRE-family HTH domain
MGLKQEISKNIRARRKQLELTQEVLAKRCKKTIRYVNYLENAAGNVTVDTLQEIAGALECEVIDLLLTGSTTKRKQDKQAALRRAPVPTTQPSEPEAIDLVIKILREAKAKYKL